MNAKTSRIAALIVILGSLAVDEACGSSSSGSAAPGGVGQACYPNGTCNAGLGCYSKICVANPGDGGAAADASTGPTVAEAAAAFAQATCSKTVGCFGVNVGFVDGPTCVARETLAVTEILTAPGGGATAGTESACAAAIGAASCADWENGAIPECGDTSGNVAPGGACGFSTQCTTDTCFVANGSVCGVCGQGEGAGASCATSSECSSPLFCAPTGVCSAFGGAGATCTVAAGNCSPGLGCQDGVCSSTPMGTACTPATQDCATYQYCSSTNSTCQPFTWAPAGGTCGWVAGDDTLWRECLVGSCVLSGAEETSTCPQVAGDGQPCSAAAVCVYPAVCAAGGMCELPNAATCK